MATRDSNSRKDIAWKYAYLANQNNKNDLTCNFCEKVAKGGAYRLKQHLVGEEEDEVAEVDAHGKRVQNVGGSGTSKKKPRHVSSMDAFVRPPKLAQMEKSGKGVQTTINDAYKKELREKAYVDIARWMYEAAISFNAVNYDSFNAAVQSIGRYEIGMKLPSYHEVRIPLLKKEVVHTNDIMKTHKEEWAKTRCSIIANGWKDKSHRSLINFLVNCSKGSMFIESIKASSYMKTAERMFQLLYSMVEKIGEDKVVQIITNNDSSYVMARRLLEAKRSHLYWTPYAAHCLDLMLEDIAKLPTIMRTIKRAIELTEYIYNRTGLINMMRQFTGQMNLLRPAKTRFATSFLTLSSIHKQKENVRKMFTSKDWTRSKWAKELTKKRVAQTVLMPTFWNTVVYSLKVSSPIVRVLRLVDGEKRPAMGYIYEAMDRAKEAIEKSFNGREERYKEIFEIIDRRWDCQLHRPLHAAGYFFNP
ncbi:uncharacterized protein LOC136064046 [Quercus suber]|uniref:uncharacterized protein LOC136064046 n=1 Tax=Quercus suber TaxID=58331 RepID=UPI0032DE9D5A